MSNLRKMAYSVAQFGAPNTLSFRTYIKNAAGAIVSPFHDIPTFVDAEKNIVNMVCEVPRWTNAKMETSKDLPMNPIVQDQKKGKARFVNNCFPHHGYIWNYGSIPQTWENPTETCKHTKCKGDNDPVDICEIGEKIATIGEVKQVKILGIMAMIDEGETDWKVLGIDVNDPLASQMNDIDDVDKVLPGLLAATNEWFRIYKMPTGKPENTFAFNGEAKNKAFTRQILEETHADWEKLIAGPAPADIALANSCCDGAFKLDAAAQAAVTADCPPLEAPAAIAAEVHKWYHIKL